jgi:hypothetical protein
MLETPSCDNIRDERFLARKQVQLGVPVVFWTCIWILTTAYAGAITYSVLAAHLKAASAATAALATAPVHAVASAPALLPSAVGVGGAGVLMPASLSLLGADGGTLGLRTLAAVGGHAALAGLLWQRALRTDLASNVDISGCYMHVWKLFYAEYILIPLLL